MKFKPQQSSDSDSMDDISSESASASDLSQTSNSQFQSDSIVVENRAVEVDEELFNFDFYDLLYIRRNMETYRKFELLRIKREKEAKL